jgi:hypothetical protein
MDGDDRVPLIELAGKQRPDLGSFDVTPERVECRRQIGGDLLALLRPLDEHGDIVGLFAKRGGQITVAFEAATPLKGLLRSRLILPEVGGRRLGLDVGQITVQAIFVKAPS